MTVKTTSKKATTAKPAPKGKVEGTELSKALKALSKVPVVTSFKFDDTSAQKLLKINRVAASKIDAQIIALTDAISALGAINNVLKDVQLHIQNALTDPAELDDDEPKKPAARGRKPSTKPVEPEAEAPKKRTKQVVITTKAKPAAKPKAKDALTVAKERAEELGMKFHPRIGLETLKARIAEFEAELAKGSKRRMSHKEVEEIASGDKPKRSTKK